MNPKIFLIIPPSPYPLLSHLYADIASLTPLGIGYLSSYLKKHGKFDTKLINLYPGIRNLDLLINLVREEKPTIVGFSTMTENFNNGVRLANVLKREFPKVKIVFGGPHVTFLDIETLKNHDSIDFVIRNEGEETFLELVNAILNRQEDFSNILGLTYRLNDKIVRTSMRPFIKDLDSLPFPDRNYVDLEGYFKVVGRTNLVLTSRGCPGACKFCAATAMSGGRYRIRSVDGIIEEIKEIISIDGNRRIFFADDTISADVNRFYDLMKELRKLNIRWFAESRVDIIDKNLIKEMVASGCEGVQFGIESGSQEILDKMNKKITISQIEKAISLSRKYGLKVVASVMIGIPGDSKESIKKTIEFSLKLREKYGVFVVAAVTVPYPGTFIAKFPHIVGIKKIHEKNYDRYSTDNPIMDLVGISASEIRSIYYDFIKKISKPLEFQRKEIYARFNLTKRIQKHYFGV